MSLATHRGASPTGPDPGVDAAAERRVLGRSFLALLTGAVAIGFAPILVRASEVGPVATAFWRLALALPVLWTLAAFAGNSASATDAETSSVGWPPMAWAGLFFAGDLAVWHWSIHFTSVASSTLLANFAPVFVVLYGWLALGHRVTRRFLLAMLVALAGTILLVGSDFRLQPRALAGDLLGLATAVFYAGYVLIVKDLRGRFSTPVIMARSGLVTGAALLPVALISGETFLPHTAHGWLVLAALALVSHVGGQSLIAFALAKLPASVASVSLLVQPVTATIAAAVLLHEPVAPWQAAGVVLVLAGVFVARQEGR